MSINLSESGNSINQSISQSFSQLTNNKTDSNINEKTKEAVRILNNASASESYSVNENADKRGLNQENIRSLLSGDTFSGVIKSINDNIAMIELYNGEYLSARLTGDINVELGKTITFMIEENTADLISIKPLESNAQEAIFINRALEAANLPLTNTNINIVKELLSLNMPVNSSLLNDISRLNNRFPDTSINTIANLLKLEMPVTKENVAQFDAYRSFEHSINNEINQISKLIPDVISNIVTADGANTGIAVLKNVILAFQPSLNDIFSQENTKSIEPDNLTGFKTESEVESVSQQNPYNNTNEKINSLLTGKQLDVLSDNISKLTIEPHQQVKNILNNEPLNTALADIVKKLSNLEFDTQDSGRIKMLQGLINSDEFKILLENLIDKNMKISPKDIATEGNISSFYEKMRSKLNKISDEISGKTSLEAALSKNLDNIKSNIDFMNDLNKNMTYFQIPVKFQSSEGNTELYVFTNKRALKNNKENISALLHLDMENLGGMDIYVKLNGKSLSTNFCMESEELVNFVLANIHKLTEKLEAMGYNTTYEMKVSNLPEDNVDFVKDFIEQDCNMHNSKQFIFDAKA